LPAKQAKEWGRSEVKRSRAGASHGEPRTEPPSEAAELSPYASLGHREGKCPRASARYDNVIMRRST
jgi:hypothetical protein